MTRRSMPAPFAPPWGPLPPVSQSSRRADPSGEPIGNTVNSFSAVSLDPPLVLWSFGRRAYSFKSYLSSDHFAMNILREGQEDVSRRFSRSLDDKWTGLDFETWDTGCPNALAVFECKMAYTYQGSDHVIFVGEVLNFDHDPNGRPLVFWHGDYRAVADHAD